MTTQTIQFNATSLRQVGSGAITAFLYSDATLVGALGSIAENATLDGRYTGTVEDKAAATYRLVVRFNGFDDSEPEYQVALLLAVGTYIASRPAVLDSAVQEKLDATWKYGDVIEFSDADSGETESHRITTAKIS